MLQSNPIQDYTKETETNTERFLHRNEPIENKGILGLDQEKSITKTQTQCFNEKKNILENEINQLNDKELNPEINHSEQNTQHNLEKGEQLAIQEQEEFLPNKTEYINTSQTTESLQSCNITIISTERITPHKTEPSRESQLKFLQDSEGNVEDNEMPEEEIEELILPDEREMKNDKSFDSIKRDYKILPRARQRTSKIEEVKEMNKNDIYYEDSLTKSTTEDNNSTEEDDFHSMNEKPDENIKDPLMCSESIPNKIVTQDIIDEEKDDNADDSSTDDDIEITEIHNSPICIDSEKEEEEYSNTNKSQTTASRSKQIITTATATVILSNNITVTRTNAKKSTCKNQSLAIPSSDCYKNQKRDPHSKRILRAAAVVTTKVVDIIDLLDDSSDEDVVVQVPSTLKKRKLLNSTSLSKTKLLNEGFPKNLQNSLVKPHVPKVTTILPKRTPQSNFLNAVQLQPITSIATDNPPAFSALLSNRSIIIPNAFYGNPPGLRTTNQTEKLCIRWLRHFVQQFANRQMLASHSCFVLLQRALKYKDFMRIKTHRVNLNSHAQNARQNIDWKLLEDLTSILFQTENDLTLHGKRFCEFTCSYREKPHKAITLMTHATSGCVTLRTWHIDDDIEEIPHISLPTTRPSILNKIHTALVTTVASATTTTITTLTQSMSLKRKRYSTNDDEEDEYIPCVPILMQQQQTQSYRDERKRSLRSKRTKRLDQNFSYNEDLLEIDLNIDKEDDDGGEAEALAEIQRKVEQKRLEAKLQRVRQAKSFESAFIQAFTKSGNNTTTSATSAFNSLSKELDTQDTGTKRIRLNSKDSLTVHDQYGASNDAEDLLQATWIENVDNIETQTISDEDNNENDFDYVQEHYISRMPASKITAKKSIRKNLLPGNYIKAAHSLKTTVMQRQLEREFISSNDSSLDGLIDEPALNKINKDGSKWPKNINPEMNVHHSYNYSVCIICKMIAQRIVNHYVNVHPGSEVYTSRLSTAQVQQLKTDVINLAHVKSYKNGQLQYEADCVFCQRRCCFLLLYWYQHFSMHTGEYEYRCKNCNIRKPTRSLLTHYHSRACPKRSFIVQDYHYDTAQPDIVASMCTLCNYLQLHRDNIIKHLQNQHNIQHILPRHIQEVTLLRRQLSDDVTEVQGNNMNSGNRRNAKDLANNKELDCHLDWRDTVGEDDNPSSSIQLPVAQQQNQYYNYMPPYLESATHILPWDNANDAHEDLSYMICDMLDVEINNE